MVMLEITTWHWSMIASLVGTFLAYVGSVPFLGTVKDPVTGVVDGYFDLGFVVTVGFAWRVVLILAASLVPPAISRLVMRKMRPESFRKVQGV